MFWRVCCSITKLPLLEDREHALYLHNLKFWREPNKIYIFIFSYIITNRKYSIYPFLRKQIKLKKVIEWFFKLCVLEIEQGDLKGKLRRHQVLWEEIWKKKDIWNEENKRQTFVLWPWGYYLINKCGEAGVITWVQFPVALQHFFLLEDIIYFILWSTSWGVTHMFMHTHTFI